MRVGDIVTIPGGDKATIIAMRGDSVLVRTTEGEGCERYSLRELEMGYVILPARPPYLKGWLRGRFVTAKRFCRKPLA